MEWTLVEKYDEGDFSIYGRFGVDIGFDWVEISAVVGVPHYARANARAAGTGRGMVTCWYRDGSDWQCLRREHADLALSHLNSHATSIYNELVEPCK